MGAGTPDLVVVAAEGRIAGAGPGTAWLPVVPDDHVAAHLSPFRVPLTHTRDPPIASPVCIQQYAFASAPARDVSCGHVRVIWGFPAQESFVVARVPGLA